MEITEELAYALLQRFAKTHLSCIDVAMGSSGFPIVVPNDSLMHKIANVGHPLLLINGSCDMLGNPSYGNSIKWKEVLNACLGQRVSWFDSYNLPNTSAQMPDSIEGLMIELDLTA